MEVRQRVVVELSRAGALEVRQQVVATEMELHAKAIRTATLVAITNAKSMMSLAV